MAIFLTIIEKSEAVIASNKAEKQDNDGVFHSVSP